MYRYKINWLKLKLMLRNTAAKRIHFSPELTVKDSFTYLGIKDFPHQTEIIESPINRCLCRVEYLPQLSLPKKGDYIPDH